MTHIVCAAALLLVFSQPSHVTHLNVPAGTISMLLREANSLVHLQVTEVLECMMPSNCRLDLQSSAFEELKKTERLLSDSGTVASTEPW